MKPSRTIRRSLVVSFAALSLGAAVLATGGAALTSASAEPTSSLPGMLVALVADIRVDSPRNSLDDEPAGRSGGAEQPLEVVPIDHMVIEHMIIEHLIVEPDAASAEPNQESSSSAAAASASAIPVETTAPSQVAAAPLRVGLQAGHWNSAALPDELARLRQNSGTSGGGVREWELNLDVARRTAALLQAQGIQVDVLPATIPPGYQADAFVAVHADGNTSGAPSGFKLARASRSRLPQVDDQLMRSIAQTYQAATRLSVDPNVTRNMTGYYAFSNTRFEHAIAPTTPAVILEMGFLTNAADRQILAQRDVLARAIADGILQFLQSRQVAN